MKKYILITFIFFVSVLTLRAQCPGCVIDQTCVANPAAPTLCPATLPDGTLNVAYDENITFYMPAQFQAQGVNVTLNKITVIGLTGMPPGLNWQTSASPQNIFYPSSNPPTSERGCVKICGTPTAFGQFNLVVSVVAEVITPFGNMTQNESFSIPLNIITPPGANASYTYAPALGCVPLDVNFEATINPQGFEYLTYNWDFNNGANSTDKIPPTQTFAQPDTYYVSLNTKKYAYRLSSITVTATGTAWCGDVEEPNIFGCVGSPDFYFLLTNAGVTQTSATINDQTTATFTGLNFIITDPVLSLQFFDEDAISVDDNLGTYLFTAPGAGTFNFSTNETMGSFTIDTVFTQQFTETDTVIAYPTPAVPIITASNSLNICQGDSLVLSVPQNSSTFQWYLNDTTLLIGATTNSLAIVNSGSYKITETNIYGCNATSANTNVQVFPLPPAPNLMVNGGTIISGASGNFQWYFNGTTIPGANQPNLLYTDTGSYTLVVTSSDGCINSSTIHITTPSGLYSLTNNQVISIAPNPAQNTLNIIPESALNTPVNIEITDIRGTKIYNKNEILLHQPIALDVSVLSNGIYFISVYNEQFRQLQKVIISK